MSDDAKVAKELVETLKDGERGFTSAAEKLRDSDRAEWATTLQRLAEQRAGFRREIVEMGHEYGDDVDESGSVAATLHRGWISLKDALTGDDAGSVLGAAATGEDHAVSEYEKGLEQDLSAGFREVVSRQHAAVVAARDEVKALQTAD
ncbi:PA2169 family four-helix-bundle protein [Terrabacter sp. NPDC000476]|uniref:ferritin-like domain-containing protein n=1 Tax=Terrabacter sp. NPDC000476 TaxID=3154258 RepID=UPI00332FFE69